MEPLSFFQTPLEMSSPFWKMIPGTSYLSSFARFYIFSLRCYKRSISLLNPPLKKEDIAKIAFFRFLVEVNETAESTFAAAALILNIQNTLICHIELAEACQDVRNVTRNAFPYSEKRSWNNLHKQNDFSHYYKPWIEKLRKLNTLVWNVVTAFFKLCTAYLTTYDLCATGLKTDRFRMNAISEVCVDPLQVLPKFNENEIKLSKFLRQSDYTDWMHKILKRHNIESVDLLKQNILKIVGIPQKVEKEGNRFSKIASTLGDLIIINPSKALKSENRNFYHAKYKELGEQLGFIEQDKSEPKPYPPYIGPTLPTKKEFLSWRSEKKLVVCKTPEKKQEVMLLDTPSKILDSPLIKNGVETVVGIFNTLYQTALGYADKVIYGESNKLQIEDNKDKEVVTKLFDSDDE